MAVLIGPTFLIELKAAGIDPTGIVWDTQTGTFLYADGVSGATRTAVATVFAAHVATRLLPTIDVYVFLQRWTAAERNLLRRRILQADAVGDALGDALDMAKIRRDIDVSSNAVTQFMTTCVNQSILTAGRAQKIVDLTQTSP
jgi:hypothetical protein